MGTKKRTISVRLDPEAKARVEGAAELQRQSAGGFLEKAGMERAHQVLLDWAIGRYRQGEAGFSELAEDTGLAGGEIVEGLGQGGSEEALQMFLASCRTVAETRRKPEFLRLGMEAAEQVRLASG